MKPSPFTYHRPTSVGEAVSTLAGLGASGKVLAGGQSLVPLMSMRLSAPDHLVDINGLAELDTVEVSDGQVRIGAGARQARVERDAVVRDTVPLLGQALVNVAHPTIRNRGTVVGSLVHADPSAELPAVLLLLGGVMELRSPDGVREVAATDFFLGPMSTAARPGDLAVAARFPCQPPGSGTSFVEVSRRHGDFALCGAAAVAVTGPDGAISSARVALVGVGGTAVVVDMTPAVRGSGGDLDPSVRDGLVDEHVDPEGDIHATADYRRELARVVTGRALEQAVGRARDGGRRR
ncbi:MAG TPA: xanthine dehydrogenase family protein subunit M [Nocardioidaceae bacterium]|nr:xanthine dehydrogenase family protein subunit M [Nocardioidaceae bacterium]